MIAIIENVDTLINPIGRGRSRRGCGKFGVFKFVFHHDDDDDDDDGDDESDGWWLLQCEFE